MWSCCSLQCYIQSLSALSVQVFLSLINSFLTIPFLKAIHLCRLFLLVIKLRSFFNFGFRFAINQIFSAQILYITFLGLFHPISLITTLHLLNNFSALLKFHFTSQEVSIVNSNGHVNSKTFLLFQPQIFYCRSILLSFNIIIHSFYNQQRH